ncbi:hypothetical protein IQB76_10595 [Leptospira borgpetersenii serovar Hardjo-bovis]|uniref:Uncharacterized protein n=1 Tax=Leptospira borgpetersenii serovar Hardjo-bovis str. Sponselee TaxID=1303729 RepID=M6BT22_LEPBO|nr:hypothetical protein LBK6_05660 [Leptospira borgpetersenii serovar Hardjo]AWV69723.1 hypothetical protein B9T54_06160 [Leptospira borgpetersenii serovar Hardjo-bovis]EMJ79503.1 hypothetical protein LEP1GSC016_2246 [Leptospira borgpetersenii serovar Hardjo-bovis str. Sponselee]TQE53035.1 hypothetical protein FFZ95_08590 [Leptospira borgpetersenii]AMX61086.1 hypothetical protein LBK9_05600 [Leptospira borgpetersenii serovar Hardjo]
MIYGFSNELYRWNTFVGVLTSEVLRQVLSINPPFRQIIPDTRVAFRKKRFKNKIKKPKSKLHIQKIKCFFQSFKARFQKTGTSF